MTTDRPYRGAMPVEDAIEELKRHQGSQFDPKVVEAFLRVLERDGAHPLHQAPAENSTNGDGANGKKAYVRVDVAGRRASASQSSN
jgi:HD-GYP domain-containing protein (c-di-GMP phosphodiesterase class II)